MKLKIIFVFCFCMGFLFGNTENAEVEKQQEQCETGDGRGCFSLGWMYKNGNGVRKDLLKPKNSMERLVI